jgi:hypothetical protein
MRRRNSRHPFSPWEREETTSWAVRSQTIHITRFVAGADLIVARALPDHRRVSR